MSEPIALKLVQQFLVLNFMEITYMENIKWSIHIISPNMKTAASVVIN